MLLVVVRRFIQCTSKDKPPNPTIDSYGENERVSGKAKEINTYEREKDRERVCF